jgi:hypothetical protein
VLVGGDIGFGIAEAVSSKRSHCPDHIHALEAEVGGGGEEVTVVAVDFLQAGVLRAGEVQRVGRAEKDGWWQRSDLCAG